jgi:LPS-assembly protein
MRRILTFVFLALLATALPARAQVSSLGGCKISFQESARFEGFNENHYKLHGQVRAQCDDVQLFAREAEVFRDTDRLLAWGDVLFVSQENRIAAERLEYNTRTRTGTFYVASGTANLANRGIDRSFFGTQEPDAYFWGETIEKLGPKTYKVTRGGFTTCVQPTPRWELVTDSATITLHEHVVLKNTLLKVKDVPLLYLPIFYYPINDEDRATGFLIPTYGSSTVKGHSISNAFFWAIDRSQDATFYHDWFSKTGQGFGGEYRFVAGPGSSGNARMYALHEHDTNYTQPNGTVTTYPGRQSYQFTGSAGQTLPAHMRLAANANYFTSIVAQQRYQQNVYAATNRTRSYGVNVTGGWAPLSLSGTFDRSEVFYNETDSSVIGSGPRITVTRPEQPLGSLPLYAGANAEYTDFVRTNQTKTVFTDQGLRRFDVTPTLRFPFTRWPFLTFNSAVSWRGTFWSESLDLLHADANGRPLQIGKPISRQFFDLSTQITGPTFTKIFSKPDKKLKHVIQPTVTLRRTTAIDNFDNIVKLDGSDYQVGRLTRITYGLVNRLYSKKTVAREVFTASITQTYNTDANATRYDLQYQSSFNVDNTGAPILLPPAHRSPVQIQVHVSPTPLMDASFRTEYDTQAHALRTLAANGAYVKASWLVASAGWSQRRFIPNLSGFNNPALVTNYLNSDTTIKAPGNIYGGTYSFNYDLHHSFFLSQRWVAYYNSQCCGVAVEYQSFNYNGSPFNLGVTQDHRFNISFTLAGIGSFSNLLGSFGGQQGR